MRKILLILMVLGLHAGIVRACRNEYTERDKQRDRQREQDLKRRDGSDMVRFNTNFDRRKIATDIRTQLMAVIIERTFMRLSDYALMLQELGKNKEALKIFESLYHQYPGEYRLASNLGTAYELDGQVDSALKYIQRGMELNPDDHEGSEWIHVKILETKLRLATDSNWLETHTVLGLDSKQRSSRAVARQIEIQLRERFPFCGGPDKIMASLFIDLADINSQVILLEDARAYYAIAMNYYGNTTAHLDDKIAECDSLLTEQWKNKTTKADSTVILRPKPYDYTTLLLDVDDEKFQVKWGVIETDPGKLLNYLNPDLPIVDSFNVLDEDVYILKPEESQKESIPFNTTKPLLILLMFLVFGCTYGFYLRRN